MTLIALTAGVQILYGCTAEQGQSIGNALDQGLAANLFSLTTK
jgi:hypothetical protein